MATRLTKLDAINRVLRAASEAPLSSLDDIPSNETLLAQQVLDEWVLDILSHGIANNTFIREFSPDADTKHIVLPTNTIAVEGWGSGILRSSSVGSNFTTVGQGTDADPLRLYDLDHDTDEFDCDVTLRVYTILEFELLPLPIQIYVTAAAAREYEAATVGDRQQQQLLMRAEDRARIRALQFDGRMKRRNMFDHRARSNGPFATLFRVKRTWR